MAFFTFQFQLLNLKGKDTNIGRLGSILLNVVSWNAHKAIVRNMYGKEL